ncbi:MAG: zinc-dependent peptidase [Chitinophagales bacterium]
MELYIILILGATTALFVISSLLPTQTKILVTRFFPTYYDAKEFEAYKRLLEKKFYYFNLLTPDEQREFVFRLKSIRISKSFVGRGIHVTDEMEILVSAALAQLTFGLEKFALLNFESIHLTPESFYSSLFGRKVKGLTFESGRMILSWADFAQGYQTGNDKINLALHEMAHAILLDRLTYGEIDFHFEDWEKTTLLELHRSRNTENILFLREYAFTNKDELWACCVECFFEAPIDFRESLPATYNQMCLILKQDMAQRITATNPA